MTRPRSAPRVILRYAMYDKIASGGMATVHLGRLLGPVGFARTVAIKRLHAQFAEDPEFVSMFLEEARLVARIAHPNVVPTIDVVHHDEELFLVMEYVLGESLARLWRASQKRGTPIPPEMVVTLMVGVLHGLHAAHEARSERGEPLGIVHRDVSPQNILVGVDGAARVLDFGIAKSVSRAQTTKEGQLKGKLSYMAPEQVRGKVTRATDIYAASIVLWELLVGQRLFVGDNEGEVFDRVLEGCKTAPGTLVPGLPAALDTATMRGLAVDPAKRFPTARAMARALEDAMPPVAPSKIGEWVESLMGERLSERTKQIAQIESDSIAAPTLEPSEDPPTSPDPGPPLPPLGDVDVTFGEGAAGGGPLQDEPVHTQLATGVSGSIRTSQLPPEARRRRSVAAGVGVAVAVGLVATLVLYRFSGSPDAKATAATSTAATSNAEALPTAAPISTSSVAPQGEPVAAAAPPTPAKVPLPADALATGSAPGVSQVREAAAPIRHATAATSTAAIPPAAPAPAAPGRAAASTQCNPPWFIDSRGVRVFKKECL